MKKRESSVTKSQADVFHVRTENGEYATIFIQHGAHSSNTVSAGGFWGRIAVLSSFGTYSSYWGACGNEFPRFLAGLNFDYAMKNMTDYKHLEFDKDASIINVKREIINDRRNGEPKELMREAWDSLVTMQDWDSRDLFIRELMDSGCRYFNECCEWATVDRYRSDCVGFWEQIWPLFIGELIKVEVPA